MSSPEYITKPQRTPRNSLHINHPYFNFTRKQFRQQIKSATFMPNLTEINAISRFRTNTLRPNRFPEENNAIQNNDINIKTIKTK